MFKQADIKKLVERYEDTFLDLQVVELELKGQLVGMDEAIHAIILAALSGETLLFIGPPGTAKSFLIRQFCALIGLNTKRDTSKLTGKKVNYFEYLLTPFTEPAELFGYFDIAKLTPSVGKPATLERLDKGHMQHAQVVFLDEVFNASSAILNALLTFMNERRFHDRGDTYDVPMEMLFSATNPSKTPAQDELGALFDRFLLRCWIHYPEAKGQFLGNLVRAGWSSATPWQDTARSKVVKPVATDMLGKLAELRKDSKIVENSIFSNTPWMDPNIVNLVGLSRQHFPGSMSNRRIIRMIRVMLFHLLYRLATTDPKNRTISGGFGHQEYALIPRFFLDGDLKRQNPGAFKQFEKRVDGAKST